MNAIKQLEVRKENKPDIDFESDDWIESSIPDYQSENGDTTLITTFVGLGLMSLAGLLFIRRKED